MIVTEDDGDDEMTLITILVQVAKFRKMQYIFVYTCLL